MWGGGPLIWASKEVQVRKNLEGAPFIRRVARSLSQWDAPAALYMFTPSGQNEQLRECKGNADRDYWNANAKTTGFWEGVGEIAKSLTVGAIAHRVAGGWGTAFSIAYDLREVPGWLKDEWKANWEYSTRIALCEAAFGDR